MSRQRIALLLVTGALLVGCNAPDTYMGTDNGSISLRGGNVTLHVANAPDAVIDAAGTLIIGDNHVVTTPEQRNLLTLYYRHVLSVHDTGLGMGKEGGSMALHALTHVFDDESSSDKDPPSQAGSSTIDKLGQQMCLAQRDMKVEQDQLAASLPAFKPYGVILGNESCDDHQGDHA